MKKIGLMAVVLMVAGSVVWAGGQAEPADEAAPTTEAMEQIVLRLGETHSQDYPTTQGDQYFADLVEERTDGRIRIEVYHSSQLGEERAVIEQVQFGAIDFTRVSISPLAAFSPGLDALQMPYLYNSTDHMWRVLKGEIGDEMLASVEDAGFVGLAWYASGARSFYNSVRPVESVADLEGLKIRVQESQLMVGLVEALGAVATPMPFGEVYSALQTGVIDGAENNWPSYYSTSHYEVAEYYTLDKHTQVPEILVASKIVMDRLSAEDQEIIRQAAKDSIDYQREKWDDFVAESEEVVRAAGNQITELSPEAVAEFQEAMQPLYDGLSDEAMAVVERVRAVK
ncbi:MAG: TRAP transporter substrate-binding protein [Spirochaeta sp.]|jgi:tripartite ATP-independent transporter DctP family solute receptor|nr:TRAP transporter substrate-binding protein [Spirochaeta sp.]